MNYHKFKHFYWNKYLVTPFSNNKYFLSYNYKYKTVWFRTYKVASRTIRRHFEEYSGDELDIYSSEVGYLPGLFHGFYKFAFVRDPLSKFLSAYGDKVLDKNYFKFPAQQYDRMKNPERFMEWLEAQNIRKLDEHFRPQFLMIDVNNLDFLGRFESFQEDFARLCETVSLPVKDFPRRNSAILTKITLSKQVEHRVKQFYNMDYKVFYPHLL